MIFAGVLRVDGEIVDSDGIAAVRSALNGVSEMTDGAGPEKEHRDRQSAIELAAAVDMAARTDHELRCRGPWEGWRNGGRCDCLKRDRIIGAISMALQLSLDGCMCGAVDPGYVCGLHRTISAIAEMSK